MGQIRQILLQVGKILQKIHEKGVIVGNVSIQNFVLSNNKVSIINLSCCQEKNNFYMGSFHGYSTGYLPPECFQEYNQNFEVYWEECQNDYHDFKPLTPENIQIISSIILNCATNFKSQQEWEDLLSLALQVISFRDLPDSLKNTSNPLESQQVWNRLVKNFQKWE